MTKDGNQIGALTKYKLMLGHMRKYVFCEPVPINRRAEFNHAKLRCEVKKTSGPKIEMRYSKFEMMDSKNGLLLHKGGRYRMICKVKDPRWAHPGYCRWGKHRHNCGYIRWKFGRVCASRKASEMRRVCQKYRGPGSAMPHGYTLGGTNAIVPEMALSIL